MREERGLSRADLGRLLRFATEEGAVGKIERGETNTRTDVLEGIAHYLAADAADLFVFPWDDNPRHEARELIRRMTPEELAALLDTLRHTLGRSKEARKGSGNAR